MSGDRSLHLHLRRLVLPLLGADTIGGHTLRRGNLSQGSMKKTITVLENGVGRLRHDVLNVLHEWRRPSPPVDHLPRYILIALRRQVLDLGLRRTERQGCP